MKEIIEYCLVTAYKKKDFVIEVNNAITQGWQPLGALSLSVDDDNDIYFAQAMVKYD